jgi:hypothetical protein
MHGQLPSDLNPGISYQALILQPEDQIPGYNNQDAPLTDTNICLLFSITSSNGSIEYQEQKQLSTDRFGMINTIIGRGQVSYGSWNEINWGSSLKFLKVEVNLNGQCTNYALLAFEELTAVPYALNAQGTNVPGPQGDSAYEVWLADGNQGSEEEFFNALKGESAYQSWMNLGNEGSEEDFIRSLKGTSGGTGTSTFEEWLALGNEGDTSDFIHSLQGESGNDGETGTSAYETWIALGNTGTEQDFMDSLKGEDATADLPDGNNNGDVLTWIWNGTTWLKQIISGNANSIELISSVNSSNQLVCEQTTIEQIRYVLSGTSTNVTVNGLPGGINSRVTNDTLYVDGTSTLDVTQATKFVYTVRSLGSDGTQVSGSITLNPSATVTLTSGELSQNSCLGQAIAPVTFTLNGSVPNANVTGLPSGVVASISGNALIISGTPSVSIADGSIFNYTVQTLAEACDPLSIQGSLIFSDCSSCDPNANAGSDATACFGDSFSPASSASNYTYLQWTTSGGGSFNNPNTPAPTYFPNSADQTAGSVILTLSVQNTNCVTPQNLTSSITLSIVDCSTVSATLVNDNICTVYNNSLSFGAEINTPNIGAIVAGGICYNTTGFPTVADNIFRLNNTGTGDWAANPPRVEGSFVNLPLNASIYIRAFCETVNGDIIYGEQIDVESDNPNLNHIYNFTNTSGNFDIDSYPVTVLSEITFKNIEKIRNFYWSSSNIVSRNIKKANFPRLDTITGQVRINNDFSIESLYAPELIKIQYDLDINNTSLEKILFPKVQEVADIDIAYNSQLDTLNLTDLKRTTSGSIYDGLLLNNNSSLKNIVLPSFLSTQRLQLLNNNAVNAIKLDSINNVSHQFFVSSNNSLKRIKAPLLFETGSSGPQTASFYIYDNDSLTRIEVNSLRKVYDQITIFNNAMFDVSNNFPCEMYVLNNDSFDCSSGGLTIDRNSINTYCFQDLTLRGNPTLTTDNVLFNSAINQYETGVNIAGGTNSFVVFEKRGVVFSTSPSPTFDGDNSSAPFYEEKGRGITSENINIYRNIHPLTTYYVRAFVEDCNGVYYGNEVSFTTN